MLLQLLLVSLALSLVKAKFNVSEDDNNCKYYWGKSIEDSNSGECLPHWHSQTYKDGMYSLYYHTIPLTEHVVQCLSEKGLEGEISPIQFSPIRRAVRICQGQPILERNATETCHKYSLLVVVSLIVCPIAATVCIVFLWRRFRNKRPNNDCEELERINESSASVEDFEERSMRYRSMENDEAETNRDDDDTSSK